MLIGGNVIIMNPSRGVVLAMATYPDYDLFSHLFLLKYISRYWDSLNPM
jgi:cell division protein FtsI/penicillin-binding protein 2